MLICGLGNSRKGCGAVFLQEKHRPATRFFLLFTRRPDQGKWERVQLLVFSSLKKTEFYRAQGLRSEKILSSTHQHQPRYKALFLMRRSSSQEKVG